MNRAARRRMGIRSTGLEQRVQQRSLPESPAAGGSHQWVVVAAWRLSEGAARAQASGAGEPVHLDAENILTVDGPGCWVCEQPWSEAVAATPCPGDPQGS